MPFDSGNISYRIYEIDTPLDNSIVPAFAADCVPPIDTLDKEPISGWVSPRFIFDREITEETIVSEHYIHAGSLKLERKIPPALLKAYCKMAELDEMRQRGVPYLNRATRTEIKKNVTDDLLPRMPPTPSTISFVLDTGRDRIFTDALSEKQQDAFCVNFNKTTKTSPKPMTPEGAALRMKQVNYRDVDPTCFSPDPKVTSTANSLGMDFLTWLWFYWETTDGTFRVSDDMANAPFAMMLEGPATFFLEGEGAHETSLRKGMPMLSREAKTALESGKKLRRCKMILAQGETVWSATVDGVDFAFRGLKLPKPEQPYEPHEAFRERMESVQIFTDAFYHLYGMFLDLLKDRATWKKTVDDMRDWVKNRKGLV